MYGQDRDANRQYFVDVWRKSTAGEALEPMERMVAEIITEHPEYHGLLDDPDKALSSDFNPESGRENPFLHMGMHIAIQEQITTDRPTGVLQLYNKLRAQFSTVHDLEHQMMECLGASLWQAQSTGQPPDESGYMACLKKMRRSGN